MGIGDWLMATAEAKHYNEKHGLPVAFWTGYADMVEDGFAVIAKGNREALKLWLERTEHAREVRR